jgi:hypothetical protein
MKNVFVLVAVLSVFGASFHPVLGKSYSYSSYGSSHYYTNVSGHRVHRPVFSATKPVGATAHCADGTWSFSEHARGTCSQHGGVVP